MCSKCSSKNHKVEESTKRLKVLDLIHNRAGPKNMAEENVIQELRSAG